MARLDGLLGLSDSGSSEKGSIGRSGEPHQDSTDLKPQMQELDHLASPEPLFGLGTSQKRSAVWRLAYPAKPTALGDSAEPAAAGHSAIAATMSSPNAKSSFMPPLKAI